MTFEDFQLNRQLYNAIEEAGYQAPTPIQEQAIPLVMGGHDVLGIAQTGTGKTAAYLLPILMKVKYAQGKMMRVLILAPTRELVMQIDETVKQLAKYTDLRHIALFGGLGPKTQIEALQAGVDIVIATPGRFLDLYSKGEIGVKELKTLVLDEADKMMDMGFMPQIRNILEVIPSKKRQNLLFSATFPPRVENLSHEFLEFPHKVEVSPQATTADMVKQRLFEVPNFMTKINLLGMLMRDHETFNRTIIFCRSKEIADNIFKYLGRKVVGENKIRVIHANKGQNTRINSMEDFKEGNIQVLVATDVAARGIDIQMVSHVINFDVPLIYEDYVHRIGRTGRANNKGEAITFMTEAEEYHIGKIEKIIKMPIPREALPVELEVLQTPFVEKQIMLREIDEQKKREDPDFKGAFHEKKDRKVKAKEKEVKNKNSTLQQEKTLVKKHLAKQNVKTQDEEEDNKKDFGVKFNAMLTPQSQSFIAHTEFEEKVKKMFKIFEHDKTLFFTVSYLILTAIGMIFSGAYFLVFDINILDYSQISDFILIAFKDPFYLLFSVLTVILTILIYYLNKWLMTKFPNYFLKQEKKRWNKWFKQTGNYYFWGYMMVLLVYIPESAYFYARYKSKEIKTGKGQVVQVYYNSDNKSVKPPFPTLVGTTSNFIFLYHPETKTTEIVPFNSVSKIVIVDSSHVSKAQTSTPKPR